MRSRKLIASLIGVIALLTLPTFMSAQSTFQTIYNFDFWDGKNPQAGMVFDKAGNLFGAAMGGGNGSRGVIFKLAPNADGSWTRTTLYNFTNGADGGSPNSPLTIDQAGNLYGTTPFAGASGHGVVFQLVPNSNGTWKENVLHSFDGADGNNPLGGVVLDRAGNLYGTTVYGGSAVCAGGCGVVYKLAPNSDGSWSESTIYAFCSQKGCRDGYGPAEDERLVLDQSGNLYGTTEAACSPGHGRSEGCAGTVFQLSPDADGSWTESVLHHFCSWGGTSKCRDGILPVSLIMDRAGNLYGAATNLDTRMVFELSPNADGSWSEKVLHYFSGTNNAPQPRGLVFDAAGNLYGDWVETGGFGEVFKLFPNSTGLWGKTVLHTFQGSDGNGPLSLVFDSAGHLFGDTVTGGANGYGTVFEITP